MYVVSATGAPALLFPAHLLRRQLIKFYRVGYTVFTIEDDGDVYTYDKYGHPSRCPYDVANYLRTKEPDHPIVIASVIDPSNLVHAVLLNEHDPFHVKVPRPNRRIARQLAAVRARRAVK